MQCDNNKAFNKDSNIDAPCIYSIHTMYDACVEILKLQAFPFYVFGNGCYPANYLGG